MILTIELFLKLNIDFNTLLTSLDRSSRQKIKKETQALKDILDLMDPVIFIEHSNQKQSNTLLFKCTWNILQDR